MPARDLRDAMAAEVEGPITPLTEATAPEYPDGQLVLTHAQQTTLVQLVMADLDAAKSARDGRSLGTDSKGTNLTFDTWLAQLQDLYFGRREPKSLPWKFCSNRSLMIAMAIVETLHARILPAVWNEALLHWRPGESSDVPKVDRINALMRWWVVNRSNLSDFLDRWVRAVISYGRAGTETNLEVLQRDRGMGPSQQEALPDGGIRIQPAQRRIDTVIQTRSDLIAPEAFLLHPGSRDVQQDPVPLKLTYTFRDLEQLERQGLAVNVTVPIVPGVTPLIDLLPVALPTTDTMDPAQMEELRRVKLRNEVVECIKEYVHVDLDGDGYAEPVILLIMPQYQLYLSGIEQASQSSRGLRHLNLTQYLPRLDDPNGLEGLGILEQVRELALEIDAIFNQMSDAHSLSILRPGFYDPSGDLDAGAITIGPNKLIPVSRPKESIYYPELDIPTERLLNAVRLVLEFIERLTAASSYILGKESEVVGGSGTATRTNAIVGAADQRFSIPMQRLRRGACQIVTHHLDLVQTFLPPGLEQRILGQDHEPLFKPNELSSEGIAGDFDAYLDPDDSLGNKETARQLSQLLWSLAITNPLVASDPMKLYVHAADIYKAFGKDPEVYLGPAPDMKATDKPSEEHTLLLQGDFSSVRASMLDHHLEHLLEHQAFLQSPQLNDPAIVPPALKDQVVQYLTGHLQEHQTVMSSMLALSAQSGGSANGPGGPGAAGGAGPTAPPVGNEPGMGAVQSPLAQSRQVQKQGDSSGAPGGGIQPRGAPPGTR